MKRIDVSGLQKNRSVFMKMGFICSLSFVLFAFNYTSYSTTIEVVNPGPVVTESDVVIERTRQEPPKPIPPSDPELNNETIAKEELTFEDPTEPDPISIDIEGETEFPIDDNWGNEEEEIEPLVEEPIDFLEEEPVLIMAEYMPAFGNCVKSAMNKAEYKVCSDQALLNYFAQNIKYPALARENKITGRVVIKFVVDEKGKVTAPNVMRGLPGGCTEEALRVLNSMPDWKPGKHNGRNVKVYFTIPINFRLE